MSKRNRKPAAAKAAPAPAAAVPALAPVKAKGKLAAYYGEVRKLFTGGASVESVCTALKLGDRQVRQCIDAIRTKEGGSGPENAAKREAVFKRTSKSTFQYLGLDGQGLAE